MSPIVCTLWLFRRHLPNLWLFRDLIPWFTPMWYHAGRFFLVILAVLVPRSSHAIFSPLGAFVQSLLEGQSQSGYLVTMFAGRYLFGTYYQLHQRLLLCA